jgi:hypothetical protein
MNINQLISIFKFQLNQEIIKEIKGSVKEIIAAQETQKKAVTHSRGNVNSSVNKTMATIDKGDAAFAQASPSTCDIEMSKVIYFSSS